MNGCAIVVIGRNEQARLQRVLAAATALGRPVLYVDSCSTDASVSIARDAGCPVLELDSSLPLSAARARNEGAAEAVRRWPSVETLQFVDGDCVLRDDWLEPALARLAAEPALGAVCGWRLEEHPRRNLFHRVAHLEWQMGAVGVIDDFAGEVLIRVAALTAAGGYDPQVVAGEDTELSSRVRAAGWRIERLPIVCAIHDIDMSTWRQWWRRSRRCGYGYALIARLHREGDQLFLPQARRVLLWGVVAPLVATGLLPRTRVPFVLVAGRYVVAGLRAARGIRPPDGGPVDRLAWGMSCSFAAVPAGVGAVQYLAEVRHRAAPKLIEYK